MYSPSGETSARKRQVCRSAKAKKTRCCTAINSGQPDMNVHYASGLTPTVCTSSRANTGGLTLYRLCLPALGMNAHTTPESARLPAKVQLPGRDPFVAAKFLRQKRRLDIPDRSGKRQSMSVLEAQFALRVRVAQLPEPLREYCFDADRRWKFDFAWPNWKIAVECEGGIWTQGRHTRALGFEADCSKYNAATVQGWRVLRFTAGMVKSGAAVETLTQAIQQAA